jgi:hypothetical protein
MLEEGVDYQFIDFTNSDITGIAIIKGKYEKVVYHYNKARVVEEGALAKLQFGFTIVSPGNHDIDSLTNDEEFVTLMGDILTQILTTQESINESLRINDIEEPDLQ